MSEKIIAADTVIPGWVDYVRLQASDIEASFFDRTEGLTAAGRYMGAAESIKQTVQHEFDEDYEPLWTVARVLQSGNVTKDQLRALWRAAQGNEDELNDLLSRLVSLGEIDP